MNIYFIYMRFIVIVLLLIALTMASGCLGEKTVIKANVIITEYNGTPIIESIDVTSAKVSKAENYMEVSSNLPGVYMNTIWNSGQIDYWRSVEYNGGGEYEIISELKTMPNEGDKVDVHIRVYDINNNQIAKSLAIIEWK